MQSSSSGAQLAPTTPESTLLRRPRARLAAPTRTAESARSLVATALATLIASPLAVVISQASCTLMRALLGEAGRPEAWTIALFSILATWTFFATDRLAKSARTFGALAVAALAGSLLLTIDPSPGDAFGLSLGLMASAGIRSFLVKRMNLSEFPVRSKFAKGAWIVLTLLASVQTVRLSSYMTDIETGWYLTTDHPWWADHMCSSAYFHAAELHLRGEENIYHAEHYPALSQTAAPTTELAGLEGYIEDPFQYPPTFLLYPLGLMAFTSDFAVMRSVGFALQFFIVCGALTAVLAWIGGRRGTLALWCLPLIFGAVPVLQNFQYGQFHLTTFALALGALVAFGKERTILGGSLLGIAIAAKLFPALLLPLLALQRKYKECFATLGACAVLACVTYLCVGAAPFEAFVNYQMPALQSGSAFAFDQVWPEMREPVVSINLSISRVWDRLYELGLVQSLEAGVWLGRLYAVGLLGLLAFFARRATSRTGQVLSWLGMLNLAVLHAGGGWADYVTAPSLLFCVVLAFEARTNPKLRVGVIVAAVLFFLALGVQPMPALLPAPIGYIASLFFALFLMGWNAWMIVRSPATLDPIEA